MIADLILNLALLVALSLISSFLVQRWPAESRTGALLQGLLFGGAAVVGMMRPLVLGAGLIFDGRSIMVSLCAYFFGPWAALPALLGPLAYRLHLGGPGTSMGSLVVVCSAVLGLAAHYWRPPAAGPIPAGRLYLLGLVVHVAMVLLMFTLPENLVWSTLQRVGPTILVAYPLATLLAGRILADREALRASEAQFRSLFESNHAVMLLVDPANGALVDANPAAVAYYGWSRAELLQRTAFDLNARTREEVSRLLRETRDGSGQKEFTFQHRRADGSQRDVDVYSGPARFGGRDLLFSIIVDVTERRQAERARDESLREKEALLKEVHHRVKNNLQVVVSLLRLEAARGDARAAPEVLAEMVGRIRSMALLHETLYGSENLAALDLGTYLKRTALQIWRSQRSVEERVRLELALAPVQLEIEQALPCGLIVNELASNCLKHAFPAEQAGCVRISLQAGGNGAGPIRLEVSDDGLGLPRDFTVSGHASLGLNLVSDLCQQLGGKLEATALPRGASFAVTFQPKGAL